MIKKNMVKSIYSVLAVIIFIAVIFLLTGHYSSPTTKYDSDKIMCEMIKLSNRNSYSFDMVLPNTGEKVKKMFIQKPGSNIRTEWKRDGQDYVFLSLESGYFEYFPNQKLAYFTPKAKKETSQYNECSDDDLRDFTVVGEDKVGDKDCYIVTFSSTDENGKKDIGSVCVWKEKGVDLYQKVGDKIIWNFENYKFNISDSLFSLPKDVKITNR